MRIRLPDALHRRTGLRMVLGGETIPSSLRTVLHDVARAEFSRGGPRSITASLKDAMMAAHALLSERNANALPQERHYLSAASAATAPGGAYVALSGWAYAICNPPGGEQSRVARSERLSRIAAPHLLGSRGQPLVTLRFVPLEPDDRLILLATREPLRWRPFSEQTETLDAEHLARRLAEQHEASHVLLLDASGHVVAEASAGTEWERERMRGRVGEGAIGRPATDSGRAERDVTAADSVAEGGANGGRGAPAASLDRPIAPSPRSQADPSPTYGSGPLVAAMGALLVFLVLLRLWLGTSSSEQQAASEVEEIRRLVTAAQQAGSLEQAREMLRLAYGFVDRMGAESVPRGLLTELQRAADQTYRVARLGAGRPLVTFESDTASVNRLVLAGEDLYLLDAAQGSIHYFTAARFAPSPGHLDSSNAILTRGRSLDGVPVGFPLAMAWVPSGREIQRPLLVVADTERTFVTYDPRQGLSRLQPGESDRWQELGPAAGADGEFYLVDSGRGLLLEYAMRGPSAAMLPHTVVDQRAGNQLKQSLDLAVSNTHIYLLSQDNGVLRFDRRGQQLPFLAQLPDQPLEAPVGISPGRRSEGLYVADAGNQRIVHFSGEGRFLRQFRAGAQAPDALAGLRAIAVDESAQLLLTLTPNGVWLFELPATS